MIPAGFIQDLLARVINGGRISLAVGLAAMVVAIVVGTIIGSSIFVQASEITNLVPSPMAVVLAWAVSGALTLVGALVCAELASAYPRTGGVYVYLKEIYSPLLGFLWGWATFWSMHTGILADVLNSVEPRPFWKTHSKLEAEYGATL